MTTPNDGGPAFPSDISPGISKRLYIATKAMEGLLSRTPTEFRDNVDYKAIAAVSFTMADTMMKIETEGVTL